MIAAFSVLALPITRRTHESSNTCLIILGSTAFANSKTFKPIGHCVSLDHEIEAEVKIYYNEDQTSDALIIVELETNEIMTSTGYLNMATEYPAISGNSFGLDTFISDEDPTYLEIALKDYTSKSCATAGVDSRDLHPPYLIV
ncbi:MAG: hypothetical protein R2827_06850 [Bdellovibrionales bacterium]